MQAEAVSPDGVLVAHVYERNCGATTDYVTLVNLQKRSFRFDPDDGVLFATDGAFDVTVRWSGPDTLVISCPTCSRKIIARQVVALGDLNIIYEIGRHGRK